MDFTPNVKDLEKIYNQRSNNQSEFVPDVSQLESLVKQNDNESFSPFAFKGDTVFPEKERNEFIQGARDIAQGPLQGLGKGGQYLASLLTGGYAPKVNMEEIFSPIGSGRQTGESKLLRGIGESLPYLPLNVNAASKLVSGLGNIGMGAGVGGLLGDEGHRLESAEFGGLLGAIPSVIPTSKKLLGLLMQHLDPGSVLEKAVAKIRGAVPEQGIAPMTQAENIQELTKRTELARRSEKESSLIPKKELMEEASENAILPTQQRGKQIVKDVTSAIGKKTNQITPEEYKSTEDALKKYYKSDMTHEDFYKLTNKLEDIHGHEGFNESHFSKIEEAITPDKPIKFGGYNKVSEAPQYYDDILQEAHEAFKRNPTLENSDILSSKLFKRYQELDKRVKAKALDPADKEYKAIKEGRSALLDDQDKFIKTLPENLQTKYSDFKKRWTSYAKKYEEKKGLPPVVKRMSMGETQDVTSGKVKSAFSSPELKPHVQQLIEEMGPSGMQNILANELSKLQSARNPSKMVQDIAKLKEQQGMGVYIPEEFETLVEKLAKKQKFRNKALGTLGTVGGLSVLGNTDIGKLLFRKLGGG